MKKKQLRTFILNEKQVVFNQEYFRKLFIANAAKRGVGIGSYEFEIAEALFVDKSAIHNWRMGVNGPGDIEKIQLLADIWNIKYEFLLTEVNEMETTTKQGMTDREKEALKKVYIAFVNYMNVFENTTGFLWNDDNTDYDIRQAYWWYGQTKNALALEYIDLKRSVYDELEELFDTELTRTLEDHYSEEDGDYPELARAEVLGWAEELREKFKNIIDPYLM